MLLIRISQLGSHSVSFACNGKWAKSLDFSLYPVLKLVIVLLLDILFIYKFQMYSIRQISQYFYFSISLIEKLKYMAINIFKGNFRAGGRKCSSSQFSIIVSARSLRLGRYVWSLRHLQIILAHTIIKSEAPPSELGI